MITRSFSAGRGMWCVAVAALLLISTSAANAQHSQYLYPVEKAVLESHADLQYQYSKLDRFGVESAGDQNISILSIELQYALKRLEIALNVPFVTNDLTEDGTNFGDIIVALKYRILGLAKQFALSTYVNTTLPTHSGDRKRDYATIQTGVAAQLALLGFTIGGNAQAIWSILGNADDRLLLGLNAFARVPIFPFIAVLAALEYYNSVHPNGDQNAFAITPGLEATIAFIHAGVSVRIAATDEAKAIFGGRAAVLLNAGARF